MKIKVLALYLGIAILSVIAATVSYNQLEESVIAEFEESQRDVCRVVKSEIIGGFDLVSRVLSHLASSSQAEKILEQDVGDLVAADKRYEGSTKEGMPEGEWNEALIEHINIQEKPLVDGFYFINPKGICLARMPWKADHVGRDYKDRPAIDQISNQQHSGLILTEQVYAVTDKAPSIALSYGLVEDGKLKIITRAIIRMDNCSARFLKELPAHCFSIINSSGLVIGDTCPDHINKDAVDVREIEDIAVTVSLEYANQTFTLRMIPDMAGLNTTLSRFRLGAYLLFGALGVAIIVGIALARDITERKKAEEERSNLREQLALEESHEKLRQTKAQLVQSAKMASIGQFAAGVAHEIRNPLTAVTMDTAFLLDELKDNDKAIKRLERIEKETDRVSDIVSSLMAFSYPDKGRISYGNINQVIEEILSFRKQSMFLDDIEIVRNFDQDLPKVEMNTNEIRQVCLNLINNAVDAMPEGGKLYIKTYAENVIRESKKKGDVSNLEHEAVCVEFKDTGKGILEERLDMLFTPFYTTKEPGKGLGLGLFISHGIIENHRGKIDVRSKIGKGTTFTVRLPVEGKDG